MNLIRVVLIASAEFRTVGIEQLVQRAAIGQGNAVDRPENRRKVGDAQNGFASLVRTDKSNSAVICIVGGLPTGSHPRNYPLRGGQADPCTGDSMF